MTIAEAGFGDDEMDGGSGDDKLYGNQGQILCWVVTDRMSYMAGKMTTNCWQQDEDLIYGNK